LGADIEQELARFGCKIADSSFQAGLIACGLTPLEAQMRLESVMGQSPENN
jgi:hypothetical protein